MIDQETPVTEEALEELIADLNTNEQLLDSMRDIFEQFRRASSQERNALNAINLRRRYYVDTEEDIDQAEATLALLQETCAPLPEPEPEVPVEEEEEPAAIEE